VVVHTVQEPAQDGQTDFSVLTVSA
jgi:hypothetical protein